MDVSQYLEIFIDETKEHIQSLNDCIMVLEKEPEDKDTINEIFRAAHSLKGMAGTMGFKRMQRLTHDMENVFQEVRSDKVKVNSSMIDVLFECLDAIEGYLDNIKESSDEGTNENEAIIAELNAMLDGSAAAPTPAPAAPEPEPEPEPAKTDAAEDNRKYLQLTLDNAEKDAIKNAEDGGHSLYGFTCYIKSECLLKAARAFLVFKAAEEFGQILVYKPSSQDIEDEKFDLDFSFIMISDEPVEKILEATGTVSEIEEMVGGPVKYDELIAHEEKKEAQEAATAAEVTQPEEIGRASCRERV